MPALPYFQLSRLTTELHLSGFTAIHRVCGRRYVRGVVFLLLCRLCLDDWTDDGGLRVPGDLTRFSSVNRLAASLGYPFETVRQSVRALEAQGVAVRTANGIALAPDPENAARVIDYYTVLHDVFIRLVEDIAATCPIDLGGAPPHRAAAAAVLGPALDVNLMPFDVQHRIDGDVTAMGLWLAIGAANIRHVTYDPALGSRNAFTPSPDASRRPIPLRQVARAVALPYATAWRHASALEAAGLLSQRPDGWVVLTDHLQAPAVRDTVIRNVDYTMRRVGEVIRAGVDPRDPGAQYLSSRPPLVAF